MVIQEPLPAWGEAVPLKLIHGKWLYGARVGPGAHLCVVARGTYRLYSKEVVVATHSSLLIINTSCLLVQFLSPALGERDGVSWASRDRKVAPL